MVTKKILLLFMLIYLGFIVLIISFLTTNIYLLIFADALLIIGVTLFIKNLKIN